MGYRAYVVTIGAENVTQTNLMLVTRTPHSLTKLKNHTEKMSSMIEDIESLPLKDIKSTILETVNLINLTSREIDAQYEAWIDLKAKMDTDGITFRELKNKLETVKTLQNQEIADLKSVLDDVYNQSVTSQMISLIVSFLVGILSSIAASFLFPKVKDKIFKKINLL